MKQVASHFGGTRNPVVMNWPSRIKDKGGLRSQFHHLIDIAPTILEAAGIPEPRIRQRRAAEADRRHQHGLHLGRCRGGRPAQRRNTSRCWAIVPCITMAGLLPAVTASFRGKPPGWATFDDDTWVVSNIEKDFSEFHDLAATEPKVRELQDIFMAEAAKYNVLPLDDRFVERADVRTKPNYLHGKTRFTYLPGTVRIPETGSPHQECPPYDSCRDRDQGRRRGGPGLLRGESPAIRSSSRTES